MSHAASQLINQIKALPPEDLREVCKEVLTLAGRIEQNTAQKGTHTEAEADSGFFDALAEIRALGRLSTAKRQVTL